MSGSVFVLGALPIVIGLFSFVLYARGILSGKTKPHVFTWLVWTVLTGIAFAAQVTEHAGAGAWFTGYSSVMCFVTFLLAYWKGEKRITKFDWGSLIVAGIALLLWSVTHDPIGAVILVTLTDACGYLPTFRKSFVRPYEESAVMFSIGILQYALAISALQTKNFATAFYPIVCLLMNAALVGMIVVRRRTYQ